MAISTAELQVMLDNAWAPLRNWSQGKVQLAREGLARQMSLVDEQRRLGQTIDAEDRAEGRSQKSFERYADLQREMDADRNKRDEAQFNRAQSAADRARSEARTQRDAERMRVAKAAAAKLNVEIPPGATTDEAEGLVNDEIAYRQSPEYVKDTFKSNQTALDDVYRKLEKLSPLTTEENKEAVTAATQAAVEANKAVEIQVPKTVIGADGKATTTMVQGYPEGYRPKTAVDFYREAVLQVRQRKAASPEVRVLINRAAWLEEAQRGLVKRVDDVSSLFPKEAATAGIDEVPVATATPSAPDPAEDMQSKIKAFVDGFTKAVPPPAPEQPSINSQALGIMARDAAMAVPRALTAAHQAITPSINYGDVIKQTLVDTGKDISRYLGGWAPQKSFLEERRMPVPVSREYWQRRLSGVGSIPDEEIPALRALAAQLGSSPQEIAQVEAGVMAGDPVAVQRTKWLYGELQRRRTTLPPAQ